MKLKNIIQTCHSCPSQWEGEIEDGRNIYIRYRWGYLSIYLSYNPGEPALAGELIYDRQLGDGLHGSILFYEIEPIIKLL